MLAGAAFPAAFLTRRFSLMLLDLADPYSRRIRPSPSRHSVCANYQVDSPSRDRVLLLGLASRLSRGVRCLLRRTLRTVSPLHLKVLSPRLMVSVGSLDLSTGQYCTKAAVGYDIDSDLLGRLSNNKAVNVVIKGLAGSLIINAIAAGMAGLSAIFALLAYFCSNRAMEVVSFVSV
jgi:hypothetical protein